MPLSKDVIKVKVDGKWIRREIDRNSWSLGQVLKLVEMEPSELEEAYYFDDEHDKCYVYDNRDFTAMITAHDEIARKYKTDVKLYVKLYVKTKKKNQQKDVPLGTEREGCCGSENGGKKDCSDENVDQVWEKLIQMIKSYALFLPPEVASIVNSDKLDELKESEEAKKFIGRFANVQLITPMSLLASIQSEDFKAFMAKVKSLFADVGNEEGCNESNSRENSARHCPVVHVGVECDGCQENPIRGPRFKCRDCANFDLCLDCRVKADHDASHSFDTIEAPRFPFGRYRRQQPCPWPTSEAKATPTKAEETSAKPEALEVKKEEVKKEKVSDAKEFASPPQTEAQDQQKSDSGDEEFEVVPPSSQAVEFEKEFRLLTEMGFTDQEKNLELLRAMDGDLKNVLQALFQN